MNELINKIVEETERLYIEWRLSPGMERKIPSLIEEKQFMYEKFAELIVRECMNLVKDCYTEPESGQSPHQTVCASTIIEEHFGVEE